MSIQINDPTRESKIPGQGQAILVVVIIAMMTTMDASRIKAAAALLTALVTALAQIKATMPRFNNRRSGRLGS
ncbi:MULTISPECIES: hypothetical protein [unclassified Kitasatospora]|uniref:hypothetical protein n=1 Tax=unclassified Kitasatospora TaxID=2633591 RepID=UPI003403C1CD